MTSKVSNGNGIEAHQMLSAIQTAWDMAPEIDEQRLSHRTRQPRVLDMHLVPQLKLAEAERVFPCLDARYPVEWKQQIRQLRNSLTHYDEEMQVRDKERVCVVSLLSMDGTRDRKGVAANLAFALASMEDTKVLLIDAKVRKPDLDGNLGLVSGRGLSEATQAQREDLPDCFRRISGTQLYLLPLGQARLLEGETIDPRGLQRLLAGLRTQFDWIVIDGPGFDTPADATMVTLSSDGTVYLIEQGVDRFEDLRLAFKQTQGRYMIGAVML